MDMNITGLAAYALAVAALAAKPGPGIVAVMSRTAARGFRGFSAYMSGAVLGEVFYLGLATFGYSYIRQDMMFITLLLKALTAVYLIWLGIKFLNETHSPQAAPQKHLSGKNAWDDFSTGLMLTLSNPLVIVFFAGIVPTVIDVDQVLIQHFIVLAAVTVMAQVPFDFLYCLPVLFSRRAFDEKALHRMKIISAVTIILVGLYIGYTAIPAQDLLSVYQ
jgi:threonine/homoserine/homoserine lactone efflux protein